MFLARSVFGCTLTEVMERLPAWEYPYWLALYCRSPWGDEWLRTGLLASITANVHRDSKKQKKPWKPTDFMPNFDTDDGRKKVRRKRVQSPAEMFQVLKNIPGVKFVTPPGTEPVKRLPRKPVQTPQEIFDALPKPVRAE